MLFTSPVFLFMFLPAVAVAYLLARSTRVRNLVLIVASMLFYCWGEPNSWWIVAFSIVFNFFIAIRLEANRSTTKGKFLLFIASAVNLACLGWFKYAQFFAESLNALFLHAHIHPVDVPHVALPLGISFYTFHSISYIVDVFRGAMPAQRSLREMILYIAFFPQLIAGPIVRYKEIANQLLERSHSTSKVALGIERFVIGLAKKILIANSVASIADQLFVIPPAQMTTPLAWLAAISFVMQVYFDFSGYSDMAVGLGLMFGFRLPENFNYPYISTSIKDFWQRWHITLSLWLRDYLYIPMGGSRKGPGWTAFNLFVVFFLCGLWHGAGWNFIAFGLYQGFFLSLERTRFGDWLARSWRPLQHLYVILVIATGFTVFRCDRIGDAVHLISLMFGVQPSLVAHVDSRIFLTTHAALLLATAIIGCTPIPKTLFAWLLNSSQAKIFSPRLATKRFLLDGGKFAWVCSAWFLSVAEVAAGSYNPFLYFRF